MWGILNDELLDCLRLLFSNLDWRSWNESCGKRLSSHLNFEDWSDILKRFEGSIWVHSSGYKRFEKQGKINWSDLVLKVGSNRSWLIDSNYGENDEWKRNF